MIVQNGELSSLFVFQPSFDFFYSKLTGSLHSSLIQKVSELKLVSCPSFS